MPSATGPRHSILLVNRYFHPDLSATSQLASDLAADLARHHDVTVVTSRQRYDDARAGLPDEDVWQGVKIRRVRTTAFGRSRLAGRTIDYLSFYATASLAVWRLARPGSAIIAKTDPPLLSVPLALIAVARRARLINWLQDLFPEIAVKLGVGGRVVRRLAGPLSMLRDWSLRRAAVNVVLGERMHDIVRKRGVPSQRITVIANWTDGALVRPIAPSDNDLRKAWGLDGAFVVGYSGNLGRAHDIETILAAMERLRRHRGRRIAWLFVGGGKLYNTLAEAIERRGLSDIVMKPYQPREALAESLSAADVHLVALQPSLEGLIVPSKFYGILAAGRPVIFIGDRDGDVGRTVERLGIGQVVATGQGEDLARAISHLAAAPDTASRMGSVAREAFDRDFSRTAALARWHSEIHRALVPACP